MRSRDGNRTFSLSLCALILFSTLTLQADEYLISYRYVVKDAILFNEDLFISKAMQKCKGTPRGTLVLDNHGSQNLKKIIQENHTLFIDYIHKLGLDLKHKQRNTNLQNTSITILTLRTTCFKVDFNDNFAKIAPLK